MGALGPQFQLYPLLFLSSVRRNAGRNGPSRFLWDPQAGWVLRERQDFRVLFDGCRTKKGRAGQG